MRIPKKFQLAGIVWDVEQVASMVGAVGATFSNEYKVQILKSANKQLKEQTFCHELVHCILFAMGKTGDTHDEVFVDAFGHLLHQYFNSQK